MGYYLDKAKEVEARLKRKAEESVSVEGLPSGYKLCYTDEQYEAELEDIRRSVRETPGFVLMWSKVLAGLVAFARDEEAARKVPQGFIVYTCDELAELALQDPSLGTMKLIHEAKKLGGKIAPNGKK